VFGAWKGLTLTGSPLVAVVMGVLTATFGGVLRDMLAGEQSVLLRPEIYVTAALAGAGVYTIAAVFQVELLLAALLGFAAAFAIRGGALRFGWSIPPYRSRPGRRPEDIP
ncbi:MAG: TRIC cation channel family protein, partial [Rhizobiaceae bacterium]|nr:TRIC cation channel family protein [Rhizobiaceae bacterium]